MIPHLPGHLTAADIARMWNVRAGTVYRLACEQQWKRIRFDRRVYYRVADLPNGPTKHAV